MITCVKTILSAHFIHVLFLGLLCDLLYFFPHNFSHVFEIKASLLLTRATENFTCIFIVYSLIVLCNVTLQLFFIVNNKIPFYCYSILFC